MAEDMVADNIQRSFKTVNGKESYAGISASTSWRWISISCFKTVNGKESYAGVAD